VLGAVEGFASDLEMLRRASISRVPSCGVISGRGEAAGQAVGGASSLAGQRMQHRVFSAWQAPALLRTLSLGSYSSPLGPPEWCLILPRHLRGGSGRGGGHCSGCSRRGPSWGAAVAAELNRGIIDP